MVSVAALLIPLISALLGGVATTISKHIVSDLGPERLTVLTFAGVLVVMAPFSPAFFSIGSLTLALPVLLGIGLVDAVANLLFFTALDNDQVSRVTALAATSPLWTAIASTVILPSQMGLGVFIATAAIVIGVYLIETDAGMQLGDQLLRPETYQVILSAVLFGLTTIPMRLMLTEWSVINAPTLYWLRAGIITVVLAAVLRPSVRDVSQRLYGIVGIKSVFVAVQWTMMLYAVSRFNVVLSKALSQTVPVFVAVLAWTFLDEPVTRRNLAAIGLIVGVVIGLQAGLPL